MEGRGFAIFQVLSVLYCAFITVCYTYPCLRKITLTAYYTAGMFSYLQHIQLNIKNDQNKLNAAPVRDSFTMPCIVNANPKMLNANVA